MRIATPASHPSRPSQPASLSRLRTLLLSWEIYVVIAIVLLAGVLRLYRIDSSTLDVDQTMIYRMARDAVLHGHLIATSNSSSIGNTNPPGAIYLMLIPAFFTADPLWGTIFLALLSTLSVLLTYLFARRYYGLLAGFGAALLYAVSHRSVAYARYIWQPNLMPFFVILFIWLLFRGVVERKRGWLAPALLLAGFIFQLHTTAVLLIAPLIVAIVLSPGTIRKRDIVLSLLALFLVYAPYIIWEIAVHFKDILELLASGKTHASIDNQVLYWYRTYIDPYDGAKPDPTTLLGHLSWLLLWVAPVMDLLLIGAMLFALLFGIRSWETARDKPRALPGREGETARDKPRALPGREGETARDEPRALPGREGETARDEPRALPGREGETARDKPRALPGREEGASLKGRNRVWEIAWSWWNGLRASPYRCGLLVLFTWQIIPMVAFTRHSLPIFRHYVMFTMPGQFILIALFVALLAHYFQVRGALWRIGRFASYLVIGMLLLAQGAGTLASDVDQARGNYVDLYAGNLYHSDIGSMHNALNQADAFAQQMHLNRLYITTDVTQNGIGYLSEQLQTAVTTFDDSRCLVLPSPASGPAILLVGPHSVLTNSLLANFASATLLAEPPHRGGPPYRIYLVRPDTAPANYQDAFPQQLQLLDSTAQKMQLDKDTFLVTRWNLLRASAPDYRRTYTYNLNAQSTGSQSWQSGGSCTFNAIRPGDHLLVAIRAKNGYVPPNLIIKTQYYEMTPHLLKLGSLTFETGNQDSTPWMYISAYDGKDSLTLPVG